MTDIITGSYTPPAGSNNQQIQEDALDKVNAQLFAEGKGIITDSSLIDITHNNDGTVTWSYNLDQPSGTGTLKDFNKAMEKLDQMLSTGDGLSDASDVMAEFFEISLKLRDVANKSDKALINEQIGKLKDAAKDLRTSANWTLAAGLVMGAAQCVAGMADLYGAAGMKTSLDEATDLTDQAMNATQNARNLETPTSELELDAPSSRPEVESEDGITDEDTDVSKRKSSASDLDESELSGKKDEPKVEAGKESPQEQLAELEQKVQQGKTEASERELDDDQQREARFERDKATDLRTKADIKMRGISRQEAFTRGVGGMAQGIGGMLKAIGDQQAMYAQADSKNAEAEATKYAADRDAMLKFRDNSQAGMQAALQGMQQVTTIETDMVKKIFV